MVRFNNDTKTYMLKAIGFGIDMAVIVTVACCTSCATAHAIIAQLCGWVFVISGGFIVHLFIPDIDDHPPVWYLERATTFFDEGGRLIALMLGGPDALILFTTIHIIHEASHIVTVVDSANRNMAMVPETKRSATWKLWVGIFVSGRVITTAIHITLTIGFILVGPMFIIPAIIIHYLNNIGGAVLILTTVARLVSAGIAADVHAALSQENRYHRS